MARPLTIPSDYNDDTPLRLDVAARLGWPEGSGITGATLRGEAAKGRLAIEIVGGKAFTTLGDIKRMRALCRLQGNEHDSGSAPGASAPTAPSAGQLGSSSMAGSISPQDALKAKLRGLSVSSPSTSRRNTSRNASNAA